MRLGADIVIRAVAKFLSGQGDALAGAAIGRKELLSEIFPYHLQLGVRSCSATHAYAITPTIALAPAVALAPVIAYAHAHTHAHAHAHTHAYAITPTITLAPAIALAPAILLVPAIAHLHAHSHAHAHVHAHAHIHAYAHAHAHAHAHVHAHAHAHAHAQVFRLLEADSSLSYVGLMLDYVAMGHAERPTTKYSLRTRLSGQVTVGGAARAAAKPECQRKQPHRQTKAKVAVKPAAKVAAAAATKAKSMKEGKDERQTLMKYTKIELIDQLLKARESQRIAEEQLQVARTKGDTVSERLLNSVKECAASEAARQTQADAFDRERLLIERASRAEGGLRAITCPILLGIVSSAICKRAEPEKGHDLFINPFSPSQLAPSGQPLSPLLPPPLNWTADMMS